MEKVEWKKDNPATIVFYVFLIADASGSCVFFTSLNKISEDAC